MILLVLFLDRNKAHLGPGGGLSDGGSVRGVVPKAGFALLASLARHAVRGNVELCGANEAQRSLRPNERHVSHFKAIPL